MKSRAGDRRCPLRHNLAKAFAFVTFFCFSIAKSKDLTLFVNKAKPMGIGPDALFGIGLVRRWLFCPSSMFRVLVRPIHFS